MGDSIEIKYLSALSDGGRLEHHGLIPLNDEVMARLAAAFDTLPKSSWDVPNVDGWMIEKTCAMFPEQFEGERVTGDAFLYFRSRHGYTTCCIADTLDHAIEGEYSGGLGVFYYDDHDEETLDDAACELIAQSIRMYETKRAGG